MYKTQIACAIFIFFIAVLYFSSAGRKNKSSKWFAVMLVCTFFQLIFDIVTVYTVNHLETVSSIVNRVAHIFYMGLMLSIFYIAYKYLESLIEEEIGQKIKRYNFSVIPLILTILGVIFLPLYYIESKRSNYSAGPAAYMTYIGVAVYIVFIIRMMKRYGNLIPKKKKKAIHVALISEIPVAIYQFIIPDSLITCIGMVLLNIGIYITTENPDALLADQLEKEKRRADSANEAKTNFLANMSHEIRTPITAVLGMNELILRESKESNIKQYARDIEGSARSLLSIINDILDITKIEAGKLSVISVEYDVSTVFRDVNNMISFKTRMKELEYITNIDENIPQKLIGDDIRLRQILVNILNNAVKYTPKGTVTLEIKRLPCEQENIAKIHFSIKDTGIGIKEEDLKKLGQSFERIEEKRNRNIEGTGLGMSITKQLLGLLHSKLEVSSVYGEGSEFSFELCQEIVDATPIGKLEEHIETEKFEYQHAFEAPEARILLVDDNELNRRVFVGLLKETKIQIDEAENGKECLEKVVQKAYDIIFLDHMMPEMDGVETLRAMKGMGDFLSKDAPVVILTANAIVGAKENYLKEGFDDFLEKPIDYRKLENMIKGLLKDSLIHEAAAPSEKADADWVELPMIEGLDWKYARTHFNNEQMMMESVEFFIKAISFDAQELEKLFMGIDTEDGRKAYCTKVHSMKNSAATVGIIPLAGMAKVLEDAARAGDVSTLERMTSIFLICWRSYQEKLSVLAKDSKQADKKSANDYRVEVNELLCQLRTAAEEMDIDTLDRIGSQLEEFDYTKEQQEFINQIQNAILNFDIDYLQAIGEF